MMPRGWNKGLTKDTNLSVQRISETMKKRKIDNFAEWRREAIATGHIRTKFSSLRKNGVLAELIGVILGDGHIQTFPRTERLLIFSNSNNTGFVERYAGMVERIFAKKPYVKKMIGKNCTRISIYENQISKRLAIPAGSRASLPARVPRWILAKRGYVVRYLRGLFEAEGSHSVHLPTGTYKFAFANRNPHLLHIVYRLMKGLGFHPSIGRDRVQLSRREEVFRAMKMLKFRKY
jgi:hypothetical protein